jgi:hypothetical protein
VNAVVRDGGGPYRARESDRSSARPLEQQAPSGGLHWRKSPQLCDFPLRSLRIGLVLCGHVGWFVGTAAMQRHNVIDHVTGTCARSPASGRARMAALEGSPRRRISLDPAVGVALAGGAAGRSGPGVAPGPTRVAAGTVADFATVGAGFATSNGAPEVPERLAWLAAGLRAMAARIRNRRIQRDYRRNRGIAEAESA